MLKIKLARFGKRKQPHYRIVINEARDRRDKSVEVIGNYAPTTVPKTLVVDIEKYEAWLKKGAQPTDTVLALVNRFKSGTAFPEKKPHLSKKAKAKAAKAAEEAAKPVEAAPVEATPEAV